MILNVNNMNLNKNSDAQLDQRASEENNQKLAEHEKLQRQRRIAEESKRHQFVVETHAVT